MKKQHFFDNPRKVNLLLMVFFGCCVVLLVINFFFSKHGHYSWEEWSCFSAAYGFVSCASLVLVAKYVLRVLAKRSENYYD